MLPLPLLPLELRFSLGAFGRLQSHARPLISRSAFSTCPTLSKRKTPARPTLQDGPVTPVTKKGAELAVPPQQTPPQPLPQAGESTQLVSRPDESTSVDTPRKVDVPLKVLPKAQITPELTLTPKERLQLEYLTRTQPRSQPKKGYRERLLIYHGGLLAHNMIVFGRCCTFVSFFTTVCVVAPAYYFHGSPLIDVAGILFFGTAPLFLFYLISRPFITWIYLPLPDFARQSPMAAIKYARNLPASAKLNINFIRFIPLPGSVDVSMNDIAPLKRGWLSNTFAWTGKRVDEGSWFRPNPTKFWVRPLSGSGKERRDVVPGIWEHVYRRIMKIESESSSKWKK